MSKTSTYFMMIERCGQFRKRKLQWSFSVLNVDGERELATYYYEQE